MLEYTRIEPPVMIIATGENVLYGTAESILLAVVRGTDDVLRTIKGPGLKINTFSCLVAAKKGVKQSLKRMAHSSTLNREVFS